MPPPVDIVVDVVNYQPLDSRRTTIELDDIVGPDSDFTSLGPSVDGVRIVDVRQLVTLDDEGNTVLTLDVETDGNSAPSVGDKLEMTDAGITPITVELRVADQVVAEHGTVIDRLADSNDRVEPTTPVDLALAALVPRPDVEADNPMAIVDGVPDAAATEQILAETTESFDALVALAEGVDVSVLAEIAPVVLATQIEAHEDPESLPATFAGDELVAVPTGSLNVSSAVAAGLTDQVGRQLADGEEALTELLRFTPTRRDVWIATEPISASGAQVLRNLGFRAIVMTPELAATLSPDGSDAELVTDRFIEVPLLDGRTIDVIVIDDLSESLTTDRTDEILDDSTALDWAIRTAVGIVLEHRRDDPSIQRSRVLSTPDLSAPDPRLVAALAHVAEGQPSVRFTPATSLAGVTDTAPLDGRSFPDSAGPDLTARVERIDATSLALASVGSMLGPDDERPTEWQQMLASLRSTAVRDSTADEAMDELLVEAQDIIDAVVPPEPFRFTLTGRSGVIPIRLVNTGDEPLDVVLQLSSPKLDFPDGDQRVTLRPNDETDVPVRVAARSNGTSAIRLEVLTPLGGSIGDPITITSRVNALTGLGQVLTGGFVLILLTWWFNNWRSRRRERDGTAATADPDDVTDPAH